MRSDADSSALRTLRLPGAPCGTRRGTARPRQRGLSVCERLLVLRVQCFDFVGQVVGDMHRAQCVEYACRVNPLRSIAFPPCGASRSGVGRTQGVSGVRRTGHVLARLGNLQCDLLRGQAQEAPDVFSQTQVSLGFPAYPRFDVDGLGTSETSRLRPGGLLRSARPPTR